MSGGERSRGAAGDEGPAADRGPALLLPSRVRAAIERDLEAAYPSEGCGVLLGEEADGVRRVTGRAAAENRVTDRDDRYLVDPETLRRLLEEEERGGPRILGFYHSHPDSEPVPSETDRELGWPWYAYLVVPVRDGRAGEGRVWTFQGDDGAPLEGELREIENEDRRTDEEHDHG